MRRSGSHGNTQCVPFGFYSNGFSRKSWFKETDFYGSRKWMFWFNITMRIFISNFSVFSYYNQSGRAPRGARQKCRRRASARHNIPSNGVNLVTTRCTSIARPTNSGPLTVHAQTLFYKIPKYVTLCPHRTFRQAKTHRAPQIV